jgi:hypothetical protein
MPPEDDSAGPSRPARDSAPPPDSESKDRTGRFHVEHRGGTRVEVGAPIHVGGDRPWMCAVKLVGRKRDEPEDPEPTQTLLVRTGRGETPEDARRDALAQLTLVYGSPVEPPPTPIIMQKPLPLLETSPPEPPEPAAAPPRRSWFERLMGRLRGEHPKSS